jgi:16S rRNA (guanine527-N7)-methyltransferase
VFRELVGRCAPLSGEQLAALESHYNLLCRWNKVLNLTRVEGVEEAVERHYCESLRVAACLPERCSVVDIGSGAGFPGLVVAIARPECSVTLVESHQRKAVFLKEAARKVPNVRVLAVRAESVQDRFDWLISRAVSYEDLAPAIRLAPRLVLLGGAEKPPDRWPFDWEAKLISGEHRFLRVGTPVSRETN